MYNLLLVDDEPWILKDMEQIIDWNKAGFNIAASLNDVNAAESLLKRKHIDVVISDIRMPGKNGLDLLSFVNRVSPRTLVVFMSAYSEFTYAKQAIENGCFNYLLKPVNVEELLQTLARCSERLSEMENEQSIRKDHKHSMMFMEWIEKDLTIQQVVEQLKMSGIPFKSDKHYAFVTVKSKETMSDEDLRSADRLLQQYGISFFRGRVSSYKWTYLLCIPELSVRNLLREVKRKSADRQWDVGISSLSVAGSRVGRLYHQSNLMVDTSILNGKTGVYQYQSKVNAAVSALREQISKASRLEHLEAALFGVQKAIAKRRIHLNGLVEIYNLFVVSIANLSAINASDMIDPIMTQDLILHYGNPHDLLEDMTMMIEEQKKKPGDVIALPIVEEITRSLDRMFAHRISLKEMAQKYYISPNYLSHLFKQEKGQSFINYLIQRRLEAAIALLEKDISLYEVGRLVGYDDYAHFSKLFKKHVGLSPFEYKQRMKPQEDRIN
ncbi:DNA-binding response regulator [Paenibacillus baekrokdamisoli]|uniref:DNA-binding response regulator n=1 Tax=Paenibacillus baekrokdamisoli TaxID=1712516 RepID=A0A3G9JH25_9BACL|nr:response regulator [Paenibacillus baekrokdamisoli]MBB3072544.1 YesN/AraC family two-component response regulator [Paenibacillus baekrokdamisoli]BBH22404.1 DNA-binding response regulator [Paenibacillus baekrokdamisoli]